MNYKHKNFYVIGDTHGVHRVIKNYIKGHDLENQIMFHVGDFGVGFKERKKEISELRDLNNFLKDKNIYLHVIRGNHDDPSFFIGQNIFSHLKLVKDYTVVSINNQNILMVGGAISPDREIIIERMLMYAQMGVLKGAEYWEDEIFKLKELTIKKLKDIDYVITHSAPDFVFPINPMSNEYNSHGSFVESFVQNDKKLKDDLNKERKDITKMYQILKDNSCNIKKWFYGHFHKSKSEVVDGTEFRLLNINEIINIETNNE